MADGSGLFPGNARLSDAELRPVLSGPPSWRVDPDPGIGNRLVKYKRIAAKRGPIKAVVALEHNILTAVWHMLANGECYIDPGADHFAKFDPLKAKNRAIPQLQTLGYEVVVTPAAA